MGVSQHEIIKTVPQDHHIQKQPIKKIDEQQFQQNLMLDGAKKRFPKSSRETGEKEVTLTGLGIQNNKQNKEGCSSWRTECGLKYLSENKKFLESNIEVMQCVEKTLQTLQKNEILKKQEFHYLNSRNTQSLQTKKKRFQYLQIQELKAKGDIALEKDESFMSSSLLLCSSGSRKRPANCKNVVSQRKRMCGSKFHLN